MKTKTKREPVTSKDLPRQLQIRTTEEFARVLIAEQERQQCSLGDAVLRAAARGLNFDPERAVYRKRPPGPRPRNGE